MYKRCISTLASIILGLFSCMIFAEPAHADFVGGLNTDKFYFCHNKVALACKNPDKACVTTQSENLTGCQQYASLVKVTNSFPTNLENYQNIDVVKAISLNGGSNFNYFMVGKPGELVKPDASINLDKAPGFLALKKQYPNAKLTDVILDFPQAVFLTQSIQKLLIYQQIVDPELGKQVGYAKVLYSFGVDGSYKGSNVMRVMVN